MAPRLPAPTEGPESFRVWEIKTLGREDDEKAKDMLGRTAWQVQPIMRKRGWKVKELLEMKPEVGTEGRVVRNRRVPSRQAPFCSLAVRFSNHRLPQKCQIDL